MEGVQNVIQWVHTVWKTCGVLISEMSAFQDWKPEEYQFIPSRSVGTSGVPVGAEWVKPPSALDLRPFWKVTDHLPLQENLRGTYRGYKISSATYLGVLQLNRWSNSLHTRYTSNQCCMDRFKVLKKRKRSMVLGTLYMFREHRNVW